MKLLQKLLGKTQTSAIPALPAEDSKDRKGMYLVAGGATSKGRVLDHNEDALFTLSAALSQEEDLLPLGLYIVADGMGGHARGEQASELAVRWIANWVLEKIYHPFLVNIDHGASQQPVNQVLIDAAVAANAKIHETCPNGGTTLTCAFILGTNAFIAHVGDSRAYLISKSTIRQITTDHSLVNRLIELGQITPEEARSHPQRNVLYRALGRAGNLDIDTYLQSLPAHSSLLLCTDGLWQMIPEATILSIVSTAASPQAACYQLIAQANEQGGEDNITAVLVQVKS